MLNPSSFLCYLDFSRPTAEFPHPLSRVKQPVGYRVSIIFLINCGIFSLLTYKFCIYLFLQLSYQVVDSLILLGIWDLINEFRKKKLKLRPMTYLSGSSNSHLNDVPYGYIWSPHLVPKPKGTFLLLPVLLVMEFGAVPLIP